MIRRLFLTLTLALLFGLGQQGALLHAIEHVAEQQSQQEKHVGGNVCDKCMVYAELAGAIPSTGIFAPAVTTGTASFTLPHVAAAAATLLPYAARAPPALV